MGTTRHRLPYRSRRSDSTTHPKHGAADCRRLRFEPLEDRRMLAVLAVSNLNDSGAGSLRDAIAQANALAGPDEITFAGAASSGTILLTSGQLEVTDTLTITGPGQDLLTLDAQQNSRVLHFQSSSTSGGDLTLEGMTLQNGVAPVDFTSVGGGGISFLSDGVLTLSGSTLSGNQTTGPHDSGGGIWSSFGEIVLNNSTLSGNKTAGDLAHGGGIYTHSGDVTLTSSTLRDNYIGGFGNDGASGGGIGTVYGDVTLTNSTLSDNIAGSFSSGGGGIRASFGNVTLTNSTLSGNIHRPGRRGVINGGGGILKISGNVTLTNSTLSNNRSQEGEGGGILALFSEATVTIENSIVAGNIDNGTAPDLQLDPDSVLTINHSLIGVAEGLTIVDNVGNLTGTAASPLAPLLGQLSDNGGPTQTHPLLLGSPALDAGGASQQATDQRGLPRVANGGNGLQPDMGAYEAQAIPPAPFFVTTALDEVDYTNDVISLREAMINADLASGHNEITFSPLFDTVQTIHLDSQLPTVTDSLTIIGPGQDLLTLDAGNGADNTFNTGDGYRIFEFAYDRLYGTGPMNDISLSGLTLTGGDVEGTSTGRYAFDQGGAIRNFDNLTISDMTIYGNATSGEDNKGGGIFHRYGRLNVSQSMIRDNISPNGGGIFIDTGIVNITSSTFSGNIAGLSGGGIYNPRTATISGSTFIGNQASFGPDIRNRGTVTISNSIVAGGIWDSGILSGSHNLFRYDIEGLSDTIVGDPLLGPLSDNGGPTLTHALLPGSPGLNAGDPSIPFVAMEYDQRGVGYSRVAFDRIDIGAYEAQIAPSADFDSDGDVDGADFLSWQRGYGKANALRADGNSDDDTDVDASDLAAWQVSFAQPQALAAVATRRQPEVNSGELIGPALIDPTLVDVALARVWLDRKLDDKSSLFFGPESHAAPFAAFANAAETKLAPPVSNKAEYSTHATDKIQDDKTRDDDSPSHQSPSHQESWLADELLERLFG